MSQSLPPPRVEFIRPAESRPSDVHFKYGLYLNSASEFAVGLPRQALEEPRYTPQEKLTQERVLKQANKLYEQNAVGRGENLEELGEASGIIKTFWQKNPRLVTPDMVRLYVQILRLLISDLKERVGFLQDLDMPSLSVGAKKVLRESINGLERKNYR